MAVIKFDAMLKPEVMKRFHRWGSDRKKEPGQFGASISSCVEWPLGEMEFPDEFVGELKRSGFPFEPYL